MTTWTEACPALLSMEFSKQQYWSGLPFPSPGDLPDPGTEPGSPALQADILPPDPPGKSQLIVLYNQEAVTNLGASQVVLVIKNPPANTGDIRDMGSIPSSGRSPGGGHSNPLQYSGLENPMDSGAWWAPVHSITQSRT